MSVQFVVSLTSMSFLCLRRCFVSSPYFRRRLNCGGKRRSSRVRLVFVLNTAFIAFVFDDRHVFPPSATARHASAAPWYASCCPRRSFELAFTPRGTCGEIAEVDSDAEETLRAKEERRIC